MRLRMDLWLLAVAAVMLTSCAQLGVPKAETFNERLAVAYGTVTEVRKASTTLLQAKKISADDHENIEKQADNARAGLDIARKLPDPKAADAKLASVRSALTALQNYLATKK